MKGKNRYIVDPSTIDATGYGIRLTANLIHGVSEEVELQLPGGFSTAR